MVKLRDLDTWKHLKGVQTGDLGPKFGYHSKDNGWARFDKVRIPRTDMLMGICDVNKDGEVEIKGDLRVLYSVMMYIRLLIVSDCGSLTLMGSQLALRYLAVRR
jgi:acyl-CoA oxidase